jgi:phage minor structural protein
LHSFHLLSTYTIRQEVLLYLFLGGDILSDLLIFDQDDSLLAVLSNEAEEACPFWNAPFKEILNNGSIFQFTVPAEHVDSQHVKAENQVAFMDKDGAFRLFVIKEPDKSNGTDGPQITAICEPAMLELNDEPLEDVRPYNTTAQNALSSALTGTRWQIGTVASLGLNSTNFYYISVTEAITMILNTWSGEIRDRIEIDENNNIVGRYIDMLTRRGADTGKTWEIDKDILFIRHKVQSYPKTALYGRGSSLETDEGGFTRKITFADVVWSKANGDPCDKPAGQEWVGDPEALLVYGRKNKNGTRRYRFGFFENGEQKEPAELLLETWNALQQQKRPLDNFEMDVFLLEDITGYEHEKVRLGDTTFAIDRSFADPIEIEERIVVYEYDVADPDNTGKVELGQYINLYADDDRIDKIEARLNDKSGIWNMIEEPITDSDLENIVPEQPTNVIATGGFKKVILEWDFNSAIYIANYEVYGSQVQGFTADPSNLLWRGKSSGFNHEADVNQQWYYRVRAVNTHDTAGAFSQEISATTARIITDDIFFGAVNASIIADLAVEAAKLANGAVTTLKIFDDAITNAKIADLAVQAAQLANSSVTATKIANLAVGTAAIQNGAITNAQIGNLAVGTAQLQDATITSAKIANLAVGNAALANAAVTNAKIGTLAVSTGQIQDLAVTNAKIANLAIDNAKIADATITSAKIASIDAVKINAVTLSAISADLGTITAGTLNAVTINTNKDITVGNNLLLGIQTDLATNKYIKFNNSSYIYGGSNITIRGTDGVLLTTQNGDIELNADGHSVQVYGTLNANAGLTVEGAGIVKTKSVNGLAMNNVTETGLYYGYSMTGSAADGNISTFEVIRYSSDWITQIQHKMGALPQPYIRDRYNGTTWGPWHRMLVEDSGTAVVPLKGGKINTSNNIARWQYSDSHYIAQNSTGQITFYMNGAAKHAFNADGSKSGGSIEIGGKWFGMSPIDSPQFLIEYIEFNISLDPEGVKVYLDPTFAQALANDFAVFPNNGQIIEKGLDYFVIAGDGVADCRIVGERYDYKNAFWADMDMIVDSEVA